MGLSYLFELRIATTLTVSGEGCSSLRLQSNEINTITTFRTIFSNPAAYNNAVEVSLKLVSLEDLPEVSARK